MALPTYKTKAEIPTGFDELYEEDAGEWKPKAGPDVSKLEETLAKVREEKKLAEKTAREAAESRADLERKLTAAGSKDEKGEVAKALARFDADLAAAKTAHETEAAALKAELRSLKLDDRARAAFIKAGGRPEKAEAALKLNAHRFDLADDRPVVKDEKGAATSQTLDDFWGKTFRADMPEFYSGTRAAGGGANGGAGSQPSVKTADVGKLLETDPKRLLDMVNAESAQ